MLNGPSGILVSVVSGLPTGRTVLRGVIRPNTRIRGSPPDKACGGDALNIYGLVNPSDWRTYREGITTIKGNASMTDDSCTPRTTATSEKSYPPSETVVSSYYGRSLERSGWHDSEPVFAVGHSMTYRSYGKCSVTNAGNSNSARRSLQDVRVDGANLTTSACPKSMPHNSSREHLPHEPFVRPRPFWTSSQIKSRFLLSPSPR